MESSIGYDPRFNRTDRELEGFFIFSVCVAGHNADTTLRGVEKFLAGMQDGETPLSYANRLYAAGELLSRLQTSGLGTYRKVAWCLKDAWDKRINLRTCTVEELEALYGVGPKTARFFVSFSRPNQKFAILDVHILRWMKSQGYDVPKNTPCGKRYLEIEQQFLKLCEAAHVDPTDADYTIWQQSREAA